jgi:hypothetical protein
MKEEDKLKSIQKKQLLKAKLAVEEESRQLADWWLPAIQTLQAEQVEWSLQYLAFARGDKYSFWLEELQTQPWKAFSFNDAAILDQDHPYIHNRIFIDYPSVHPLRYLPELAHNADPAYTASQAMQWASGFIYTEEQPVYLFFARFPPVIILSLSSVIRLADSELLLPGEDVCITPMNFDWLIFRSLEDQWRFGHKK